MSWQDAHSRSEQFASEADLALRSRDYASAITLYGKSADQEILAVSKIPPGLARTLGILAVSAAALLCRAERYGEAEDFCIKVLNNTQLPSFAKFEVRQLLQDAWVEIDKAKSGVEFLPGQALVSIKGGSVVYGGAPLDLVVDKVKGIQSIFYRTIEFSRGDPLRTRGEPKQEIVESCRPWLFQAPPGSYQFSVAVQKPKQMDFFREDMDPTAVVSKFLGIIRAGAMGDTVELEALVPDRGYRKAFLKLTHGLAPTGKLFDTMEIKNPGGVSVVLDVSARSRIGAHVKSEAEGDGPAESTTRVILGALRALDLDKDWIELSSNEGERQPKVYGIRDTLEDVIGPMVNRQVRVTVRDTGTRLSFVDIELDE